MRTVRKEECYVNTKTIYIAPKSMHESRSIPTPVSQYRAIWVCTWVFKTRWVL